jgi:hypothetical protein
MVRFNSRGLPYRPEFRRLRILQCEICFEKREILECDIGRICLECANRLLVVMRNIKIRFKAYERSRQKYNKYLDTIVKAKEKLKTNN